jgi:hypothetical protein
MGSSIAMIRHYGRLACDSREHAVALLDALALERAVDAAVDVVANAAEANQEAGFELASAPVARCCGRAVDAAPRVVASTDDEGN